LLFLKYPWYLIGTSSIIFEIQVVRMSGKDMPPIWDLSALVESEDPEKVKRKMDAHLKAAEVINEKYKGHIKDLSPSQICDLYREIDVVESAWMHTLRYVYLRQRQNIEDKIANGLLEYCMKIDSEFWSRLVFFDIEIRGALENNPELVDDPAVKEYRHALERAKEKGKYLLSESDERLIMEKDHYGIDGWSQVHGQLKGMRRQSVVIKGEEKELGFTELRSIAESDPDRTSRKVAIEALYTMLSVDRVVYATALRCVFGDHLNQVRLRKYPSVLTKSLIEDDISQTTLDALIASMRKNTPLVRRFLKLRAKAMGLPKLAGYDIAPGSIAPITDVQSDISWSEARRLIIESFSDFDEEAGRFATSLFQHKRIDAEVRPNKFGQAFCAEFPALRTSYIMVNYSGAFSGISALAHECGHGLHAYYASEKHKWINFHFGNCFVETGSIFAEMLLADKLLKESSDDETKLAVLDKVLCGVYMLIFCILNLYLFEYRVFEALEKNETIDADKLDSTWIDARTEIFGESIEWPSGMEQFWMIPGQHFWARTRFYNYPYAFGELLVLVLYHLYKEDSASFGPKIKHILSTGDSMSPETLLDQIGLDLNDSGFWELGFKQAEAYLKEFEKLVKNRTKF